MNVHINKHTVITTDDDLLSLNILNQLLKQDSEIELVASCNNGADAIKTINQLKPDILLLDIQMPEINGFDVLKELKPKVNPIVIFLTAYSSYALKAFEANAIAYLLKPVSNEQFFKKLTQAKILCMEEKKQKILQHACLPEVKQNLHENETDKIIIKDNGEIIFLNIKDIQWIDAANYKVNIQTPIKNYLVRETVKSLEQKLNPNQFIRVHRSTIVNIDQIKSIQPYFKSDYVVIMKDGKKFRMSRPRKEQIKQQFGL